MRTNMQKQKKKHFKFYIVVIEVFILQIYVY